MEPGRKPKTNQWNGEGFTNKPMELGRGSQTNQQNWGEGHKQTNETREWGHKENKRTIEGSQTIQCSQDGVTNKPTEPGSHKQTNRAVEGVTKKTDGSGEGSHTTDQWNQGGGRINRPTELMRRAQTGQWNQRWRESQTDQCRTDGGGGGSQTIQCKAKLA